MQVPEETSDIHAPCLLHLVAQACIWWYRLTSGGKGLHLVVQALPFPCPASHLAPATLAYVDPLPLRLTLIFAKFFYVRCCVKLLDFVWRLLHLTSIVLTGTATERLL